MLKLPQFYDLPEELIAQQPISPGALYIANDTGCMYFDSVDTGRRIDISKNIIILSTESDRNSIANPASGRLYCVLVSGCVYLYIDNKWYRLGNRPQLHFKNIIIQKNVQLEIEDDRILDGDVATFYPDLSVCDLVANSTCICTDGKLVVSVESNFDIPGHVIVN